MSQQRSDRGHGNASHGQSTGEGMSQVMPSGPFNPCGNHRLPIQSHEVTGIQGLRILPLRASTFLTYRLTGATLLATVGAWLIIRWGGLVPVREVPAILLATQFGLLAPLISLVVSTFARNKIEGLAYFKILDLIILLPMVSFFFPGWWTWLLAVVPVFWSFHAYESAIHGSHFALWMLTGFLVYALAMRILGHWFRKKVWNGL